MADLRLLRDFLENPERARELMEKKIDEFTRERDEARALVSELANAIADSCADIDIKLMIKATSALDKWGE
jgi:hypothetical protein